MNHKTTQNGHIYDITQERKRLIQVFKDSVYNMGFLWRTLYAMKANKVKIFRHNKLIKFVVLAVLIPTGISFKQFLLTETLLPSIKMLGGMLTKFNHS